jgi:hypothetical protein
MDKESIFAVIVGSSIIIMWSFLIITGQVPEYEYKPIETLFSITADNITAILVIIGGIGVYKKKSWGNKLYLVSMGALFYSLMIAIGYYSQLKQYIMLALFVPIFFGMVYFIIKILKDASVD